MIIELPKSVVVATIDTDTLSTTIKQHPLRFYNKRNYNSRTAINTLKRLLYRTCELSHSEIESAKFNIIELENKNFKLGYSLALDQLENRGVINVPEYINYGCYWNTIHLTVEHPQLPKKDFVYSFHVDNKEFPKLLQMIFLSGGTSHFNDLNGYFCYDPENQFFIPERPDDLNFKERATCGSLLTKTPEQIQIGNSYLMELRNTYDKKIIKKVDVLGLYDNINIYTPHSWSYKTINCIPEDFSYVDHTYVYRESGVWLFRDINTNTYFLYRRPEKLKGILLGKSKEKPISRSEFIDLSFKNSWLLNMYCSGISQECKETIKQILITDIVDKTKRINKKIRCYGISSPYTSSSSSGFGSIYGSTCILDLSQMKPEDLINLLESNSYNESTYYGDFDMFIKLYNKRLFDFSKNEIEDIIKEVFKLI